MLWRRSAQPLIPSLASSVPQGEAVRLSALQASWRRDRWVARRRLVWRWLMWASWRYLMPLVAALSVVWLIWFFIVPAFGWRSPPTADSVPLQPTAVQAGLVSPVDNIEKKPPLDIEQRPLKLHLETGWVSTPKASAPPNDSPSPDSTSAYTPQLKPENWLHSKEP